MINCLESDTFTPDLNKVLNSQLNYGLTNHKQFTKLIFNYDRFLPTNNKLNPCLLNISPVNYDFGFGSWLKVVFFVNTMKINVVDNSSRISVNSNNSPSVNSIEFKTEQSPQHLFLATNQTNNEQPSQPTTVKKSSFANDYMWIWKHLLAGATAGVASRTCTAPLDRIKVLLQVKSAEIPSVRSCYRFIKKEGGYRSFWRGNGINCMKIAPEIALRFMFYEQIKRYIKGDSDRQLVIFERFVSGSFAGALSQSFIYPMEVIKTRLCLRTTGQYSGILDAIKKINRIEGYRTFYRGFFVNLAGILPYSGIDLAVYETLKNFYLENYEDEDPGVPVVLLCGITSNICGQLFSYPLALIRTRLQASNDKSISLKTISKQIYHKHSLKGFYRGFIPNLIKVAPANAITYIVYERVTQFFNVKMS